MFYMFEFLLRAEKRGVEILDYPVEWQEDYNTTVKIFKTICNYLVHIARLFKEFYIKKNIRTQHDSEERHEHTYQKDRPRKGLRGA